MRTGESSFDATLFVVPSIRLATFQRNWMIGALLTSNLTRWLSPLAAASACALSTTAPASSTNLNSVGVLVAPSLNTSQPDGRAVPGLAAENGATSGAPSGCCASATDDAARASARIRGFAAGIVTGLDDEYVEVIPQQTRSRLPL